MLMNNANFDLRFHPIAHFGGSGKRPKLDFAKDMTYLRRFTKRHEKDVVQQVLPYKVRLYVLANDLFIDYEVCNSPALENALPNRQFTGVDPAVYEALESFECYVECHATMTP